MGTYAETTSTTRSATCSRWRTRPSRAAAGRAATPTSEPSQIDGRRDEQPAVRDEPARRPGRGPVLRHVHARRARQHDAHAAPAGDDMGRARPPALDHAPGRDRRHARDDLLHLRRGGTAHAQGHRQRQADAPATRRKERHLPRRARDLSRVRADGTTVTLARETLAVDGRPSRVALLETTHGRQRRRAGAVVRYQHGNHLASRRARARRGGGGHHRTRSTSRTAARPTRPSAARPRRRSATATPARSATKRAASTTTARATTRRGSAAGAASTPR